MSVWAVIPAAGAGTRLGGGTAKALRSIAGESMVSHAARALLGAPSVNGVVVVGSHEVYHSVQLWAPQAIGVEGAATRQGSVYRGLAALPRECVRVIVHDAARPLVTSDLVERVVMALRNADAAIAAIPMTDTVKAVAGDLVEATVPRDGLWRAQTPQAFRLSTLLVAHERAVFDNYEGTDDAELVERLDIKPVIVPGDEMNIKVTTDAELAFAEAMLLSRKANS